MTDQAKDTMFAIVEKWGFPTLVALALGWFLRTDLLLPLLDSHRQTLAEICQTQKEITSAIQEQTRLLYALQPRVTSTGTTQPGQN